MLLLPTPFSATMPHLTYFLLLAIYSLHPFSSLAKHATHISSTITVVGVVYCDTCSTNSFSKHSYFLPGVDVQIECTFKANAPKTAEQINFSVNRTTNRYGTYKLEVPDVDGVDCVEGSAIESLCHASLIRSSSSACDVVGLKTTTNQISIKSKQDNHCIYSLNALSFRPAKRNSTLCENRKQQQTLTTFNSSKFFLPNLPPFRWPYPLPPFPYSSPQSLPFPFPSLLPSPSFLQPPPPPSFNLGDPTTWTPHIPSIPSSPPPPPPAFNLRDPKTWTPQYPPSPPGVPQNENP